MPSLLSLRFAALSAFFLALASFASALDPYDIIENLAPRSKLPRVINSEDIPALKPSDPRPLSLPAGDFNKDGNEDLVISGIYNLPTDDKRYFLLVGGFVKSKSAYQRLFFEEFSVPVFIYTPGATGEADPKDQAFSISFCVGCEEGLDFYWNGKKRAFDRKPWSARIKRSQSVITVPAVQVSSETADQALKIVSQLPDVQAYILTLKKKKKTLGTRVEPMNENAGRCAVRIYEKLRNKEVLYDLIEVSVSDGRILGRKKKR